MVEAEGKKMQQEYQGQWGRGEEVLQAAGEPMDRAIAEQWYILTGAVACGGQHKGKCKRREAKGTYYGQTAILVPQPLCCWGDESEELGVKE